MSKNIIWFIVAAAILAVAWFLYADRTSQPATEAETIAVEVQNLDLGNLDAEFGDIDQELNKL